VTPRVARDPRRRVKDNSRSSSLTRIAACSRFIALAVLTIRPTVAAKFISAGGGGPGGRGSPGTRKIVRYDDLRRAGGGEGCSAEA
jgi:hypothetical protein